VAHLEIKDLIVKHKSMDGLRTVLEIDSLKIEKGETYGIIGESGQGKTVLALTCLGLLPKPPGVIERGEILLEGRNLLRLSDRQLQSEIRGKKMAMIFQDPMSCLNPVFTVGTQLCDVLQQNRGLSKKESMEGAMRMLETVRLADVGSIMLKYPHQLSGGQRQRVIIALALCCGAQFLIADEPTRNLDVTIQASILKLIKELQARYGMTVLFITNNMSLVPAFCDRIGVLRDGHIIEEGRTGDVILNPQQEYTKMLIRAVRPRTDRNPTDPNAKTILEVRELKKYFIINDALKKQKNLTLKAVDGVSFSLRQGEALGIVGESGCGKSTLVNTILNLYQPTSGEVYYDGKNIFEGGNKRDYAFKKSVQIVFQDPYWSLNPRWLVKDIVAEPIDVYEKPRESERLKRVSELLDMVGLPADAAFRYPHEFSGGHRQRIAIARALASNPKLVVLDEPTSSIDVFSQAQILALIKDLRRRLNLTIILISHDLGVVSELANKVLIMYLGKIVELGETETIFADPKHPYTKALFSSIPRLDTVGMEHIVTLEGTIPSPIDPPPGCSFHTRCVNASPECARWQPHPIYMDGEHYVSCILYEPKEGGVAAHA
jgi:peptide/nickel transport system ATP-binding protein